VLFGDAGPTHLICREPGPLAFREKILQSRNRDGADDEAMTRSVATLILEKNREGLLASATERLLHPPCMLRIEA
jgi:hypothetical protein